MHTNSIHVNVIYSNWHGRSTDFTLRMICKQVGFLQKKETNTFGSKILKNLGLKKSGHLEIRDYLNFSQFFTLGQ